ncbi:MAG: hypothetical protein A2664_04355 [Candidatus Taylorbacteria bacterium RIFCSPHIGHO2_01_FULL_46_22b]|uniref:MobA-like NTP transferase domain-containing protein n=1 Tax=Candidatus Taylorbacteria bacterium RIFCSPHIGHO2_01_FULL_46_22b TaxID=1802301 RepID=A0A1G2M1P2_9BACT|nr:MAG: hypothetical protein A2664_04355 [Candidatus Taylorbacteria bacterium RIFCSPHIGHO2_01_FULL_46_22b]
MNKIQLVILAAGKGKRMQSELPKALLPLAGKPLLQHLLDAVDSSKLDVPPTLVVGVGSDQVKSVAGPRYQYVFQNEQLGTGHAVKITEELLKDKATHIMVLYGDHPLVDAETINKLGEAHLKGKTPITMATVHIPDFESWREGFRDYGRVIRNTLGEIEKIVERKDASLQELLVREVNPSYFCFDANWLWENLKEIKNDNTQQEYYLTDLPSRAHKNGERITTVSIDPVAALGANTREQLTVLERILSEGR